MGRPHADRVKAEERAQLKERLQSDTMSLYRTRLVPEGNDRVTQVIFTPESCPTRSDLHHSSDHCVIRRNVAEAQDGNLQSGRGQRQQVVMTEQLAKTHTNIHSPSCILAGGGHAMPDFHHSMKDSLTPEQGVDTVVWLLSRGCNHKPKWTLLSGPQDGVHPPAAGLDPQLPPGGAEVNVSAGGLGQDIPATLRQQETGNQ
ncbi:dehydrogenase/reductase SDR family member 12-like isoform X2 [Lates japonicus]|uniref:Dehydrogenase/reductase SDR family member 12-like isoform X2 n=1 Tax=Lates japonicus TaxID=270547 RepID=A0AAD3MFL0_LATJO|nr:dehydrogenase/reductase SDR family member 12-like isoform X2 [Lates japonicus]